MSAINARCGASQQSIASGDACRIVFISQASSYKPMTLVAGGTTVPALGIASSGVYPNCFWRPESAFIKAVYTDYGLTELVLETTLERSQVAMHFANLYRAALRTQPGENRFHDLAFDFQAFVETHVPRLCERFEPQKWLLPTVVIDDNSFDEGLQACWAYLCDMVRRYRVFVHGYCQYVRPLAAFILHEHAYQGLVEYMYAQEDWDGKSYEMTAYLARAVEQAYAELDRVARMPPEPDADESRVALRKSMAFIESIRTARNAYDVDNIASDSIARHMFDNLVHDLHDQRLSTEEFVRQGAVLMQERAAICAMNAFEIPFQPMTYVGADFTNAVGSACCRFISTVNERVTRDRQRETR
jgi:hypothetical protein